MQSDGMTTFDELGAVLEELGSPDGDDYSEMIATAVWMILAAGVALLVLAVMPPGPVPSRLHGQWCYTLRRAVQAYHSGRLDWWPLADSLSAR